jgi:hypothetical protein
MRTGSTLVYTNLAILHERYGAPGGLAPYELRVFSQNGEDGVLAEILHRIGSGGRWFVEFGIGPGLEGTCVLLADVHGWSGLFIEGADDHAAALAEKYRRIDRIRTLQSLVTVENVEQLFAEAGVPEDLDVLSIDIDGNDYWVWQAIERYTPRVVVCEYNGAIDPGLAVTQPYDATGGWDGTEFFGASLGAIVGLGAAKGYRLVHTDLTGTNAFFVREDLAEAFADCADVPARAASYSFTDFRHLPADPDRRFVPVDDSHDGRGPGSDA